ncbi:MAG: DoxX family protein [Bacteroidota bacterium]|nr:DoxX family protein [Bacteroidota bacterium]
MNKLIATDSNNWPALISRLALGFTIFPHGAQKLLGIFGGYGFNGTMGFLTGTMHLPYVIGLLVILIEFFGSLFLIFGFLTRIAAIGFTGLYAGVVITVHAANGFFMNWGMQPNKGEGWEFFILLFGLAIISLILGGGKASIDAAIQKKIKNNYAVKTQSK